METKEIRLLNLLRVIREDFQGNKAALARSINKKPEYLSRWSSKDPNNRRNISSESARQIEWAAGRPRGWMDTIDPKNTDIQRSENVTQVEDSHGLPPVLSWEAVGQFAERKVPGETEEEAKPMYTDYGPSTYRLRVEGDSMVSAHGKSYPDGCFIFVDPDEASAALSGDRVVAILEATGKPTFKQFIDEGGQMYLKSLNPS